MSKPETRIITIELTEQEALLICDVFDGQPFGSLIRMAGLTLTQRIRKQIYDQREHVTDDGGIRHEVIIPKGVSTKRMDTDGVVHEMADMGIETACGIDMAPPWVWTDKRVTCKACKKARKTARSA